jgi:hypothetical protein
MLDKAAAELSDTEKMVEAAEALYGPYQWGRYDLLVLPPSFPFGGMENPTLTFLTPTFIAGDKSNNNIYWPRVRRFNDAIAAMALREICRIGAQFTWTNRQFDPIICAMDRVLVSLAWEAMFPLCSLTTITRIGSDHTPLAGRRRHVGNHGSFSIHGGLGSDGFRS